MVECAQGGITLAKLGFIGTGTMGNPIAVRLLDAGHELVVCDASSAATANLEQRGARRVDTPREVAQECAVRVQLAAGSAAGARGRVGRDGILAAKRAGLVHVDLSTSSFEAVQSLCAIEAAAGATLIDAPVSGGAHGAAQGTLAVMASGERKPSTRCARSSTRSRRTSSTSARPGAARSRSSSTT
jgi:3-hydroxyisobutyrate dehydrogenase-like beta-hydroxyacid dehydrogenase